MDLPQGCWHHMLQFADPDTIARIAALNRTSRTASKDDRLWYKHFKEGLSPEPCVSPLSSLHVSSKGLEARAYLIDSQSPLLPTPCVY